MVSVRSWSRGEGRRKAGQRWRIALAGLGAPQAQAIEVYTGASPATHLNDDLITQVRGGGRGGVRHGGVQPG
jgi:hypothetical protein